MKWNCQRLQEEQSIKYKMRSAVDCIISYQTMSNVPQVLSRVGGGDAGGISEDSVRWMSLACDALISLSL